ncbi:MAG: hypothetical protein LC624_06175 [Halobacteriales archaeon]|nr:hypothetical protein [Halobacteriales archaeon]
MMAQVLMQAGSRFQGPPGGNLQLAISFVSIGLLIALVAVFLSTWRKTRSPFMLGLLVFAAALLLEDLARVAGFLVPAFGPRIVVVPELLELLALAVLLYLATR